MTEVSEKWEPPSILDVDNEGFVMVRELLYARANEDFHATVGGNSNI